MHRVPAMCMEACVALVILAPVFLVLDIFVDRAFIIALFVPDVVHLENYAAFRRRIDQQHHARDYDHQREDRKQDALEHVLLHLNTNLLVILAKADNAH